MKARKAMALAMTAAMVGGLMTVQHYLLHYTFYIQSVLQHRTGNCKRESRRAWI